MYLTKNALKHGDKNVITWLQKRQPGEDVSAFADALEDILKE